MGAALALIPRAPDRGPDDSAVHDRVTFALVATAPGTRARAGVLATAHGAIATPVFMPVGTRGTVRTQTLDQLELLGAPMLLANTVHLMQRPGQASFERTGGLHRWMGWRGAILTDSGGFQVFSLEHARPLDDDGATLRSGPDGPLIRLTPEGSIAMQRAIGADVMMVLDECVPSTCDLARATAAMDRTHRWARRCLAVRGEGAQQLFAIVQGAQYPALRRQSALELAAIEGFDGYAIGGLAVGESRAEREDLTELVTELVPADRPRYLMGVGTPLDLIEAVHRGVDMFDCVLPTAWAQQGQVFTSLGRVDLRRGVHRVADDPLDPACDCAACTRYGRSYLHHLIKCQEPLGWQLLAFHNLRFFVELMRAARAEILAGTFAAFHARMRVALAQRDPRDPPGRRPRVKRPRTHDC